MAFVNASEIVTRATRSDYITPKEFAYLKSAKDGKSYSVRSAQKFFESLVGTGKVRRVGTPTKRYPNGKLLVMSAECAGEVLSDPR